MLKSLSSSCQKAILQLDLIRRTKTKQSILLVLKEVCSLDLRQEHHHHQASLPVQACPDMTAAAQSTHMQVAERSAVCYRSFQAWYCISCRTLTSWAQQALSSKPHQDSPEIFWCPRNRLPTPLRHRKSSISQKPNEIQRHAQQSQ